LHLATVYLDPVISVTFRPDLVDMSCEAVTSRLIECAEISALTFELVAAGEALRGRR
jgi:hypothetical protein